MKPLVSADELNRLMPQLSEGQAVTYAPLLSSAMLECQIISKARRCAFLSNLAHESVQLTRWNENLNYSAGRLIVVFPYHFKTVDVAERYAHKPVAIANRVYAERMGNGNEQSGDGWNFRGRGPIGLTGKDNYKLFGKLLGVDLFSNPENANSHDYAFRIAAHFWLRAGCNELADKLALKGDAQDRSVLTQICRKINGGANGLADRLNYFRIAKQALHNDDDPVAPPVLREVESDDESAAESESPAEVSADTDVDLLDAAVNSSQVKSSAKSLTPRLLKHSGAGLTWLGAMYEVHQMGTLIVVLIVIAGIVWLVYHNRAALKRGVVKLLK